MRQTFVPRTLAPGALLQRAGQPARVAAVGATGCLRSYFVDERGREHIVQFAADTWWLADIASLSSGAPSRFFFQAIEESTVLLVSPAGHEAFLRRVPGYRDAFRGGLQKHAAAKDERIAAVLSASPEARYLEFLQTYPSIAARVPQWMIASYLGVTPETLSRVRGGLTRRSRSARR